MTNEERLSRAFDERQTQLKSCAKKPRRKNVGFASFFLKEGIGGQNEFRLKRGACAVQTHAPAVGKFFSSRLQAFADFCSDLTWGHLIA